MIWWSWNNFGQGLCQGCQQKLKYTVYDTQSGVSHNTLAFNGGDYAQGICQTLHCHYNGCLPLPGVYWHAYYHTHQSCKATDNYFAIHSLQQKFSYMIIMKYNCSQSCLNLWQFLSSLVNAYTPCTMVNNIDNKWKTIRDTDSMTGETLVTVGNPGQLPRTHPCLGTQLL